MGIREKKIHRALFVASKLARRRGSIARAAGEFMPRDYQIEGVRDSLDWAVSNPCGRLLFVLPPGGGKTLVVAIFLRLCVAAGLKVIIVAHRREIIDLHWKTLLRCGLDPSMIGVIMSGDERRNPDAFVQIASIGTLNRMKKWPDAQVIVTDEAHHDASERRHAFRAHYSSSFRFGITATPDRLDGRGLAGEFDHMIVGSTTSALIMDGYLAMPKTFTVPEELLPDTRLVPIRLGEFQARALSRIVCRRNLVGAIVEHWFRLAGGRTTVVFAAGIKHSKLIVAAFKRAGVLAKHLDGKTPLGERDAMLADLGSGRLQVVSCCDVLAEGWDLDRCKCVVLARPTMSLNLYLQQASRGMRPWRGVVPLILDHAGNAIFHGLAEADQSWRLEEGVSRAARAPAVRICSNSECKRVVSASCQACPECGTKFREKDRVPKEVPGQLREYVPSHADVKADLEHIKQFAARKNLGDDWVQKVIVAKYGRMTAFGETAQSRKAGAVC